MLGNFVRFFLDNKLIAFLLLCGFMAWGLVTAPFEFGLDNLPRDPVSVDAIPDIGENQQIVFTQWEGRSPQDVEDQVTYPLTTALLGVPGVKSIRSNSMFGFSSIYVIFDDDVEFYWSRSRILEKLNALPTNILPGNVQPTLGPDATALGQIYWYTLEGRDRNGQPTGGWDLHELRTIQDFYVRFGLSSAKGVAEVASIGGFVKEYQVDVDPEAMKNYGIQLDQVMKAIRNSNIDVGAQTIEINLVEYFVRGLGYIQSVGDIESSVVKEVDNTSIRIGDIAKVQIAPAERRGVLDKSGAEAVGGVVVARYGANPMEVIQNIKAKITEIEPGLPTKTLSDGTVSQLKIVPFYDRSQLINETLGTLQEALGLEVLVTILVVILMLLNLRSSLLVSGTLPVAVLMCFIAMKYFGVDANIVALSGIAIAIGTMVDMGIVLAESMVRRLEEAPSGESVRESIYLATVEVASAVLTAVATTIISFLPVFTMEAAEGKLFTPLAYTKTFALVASIIVAITIVPPFAHIVFAVGVNRKQISQLFNLLAVLIGALGVYYEQLLLGILLLIGLAGLILSVVKKYSSERNVVIISGAFNIGIALLVAWLLVLIWMPLGVNQSLLKNYLFIILLTGGLIGIFYLVIHFYAVILGFLLRFKLLFLILVGFIVYQGYLVFIDTGEEFMPALDEGSFLLMPTSMPHSGMQENIKNLRLLDMAVTAIPEVETVVGKAGRVNSALDPAPMSMYENVILYKSEYKTDQYGHRQRYLYENGAYVKDSLGNLIPDENGKYFRQWRDGIRSPDDIWKEIVNATKIPGVTSAPKLQPIETRLVMLQTGMRAPMGIKVRGGNLDSIETFALQLEKYLKAVDGVKDASVFADRIVGKPYLLLDVNRKVIGRYGLSINDIQQHIQAAIGGMTMTTTVEGRERYNIRVRYPRELRNNPGSLEKIYISTPDGQQIPLGDMVQIQYQQGAQSIKSEDGFLVGYVLFDKEGDFSEVEVVNNAQEYLQKLIKDGELAIPAGVSYRFAGNYEQQVRAKKRLSIVLPLALALIFLILYFQFKSAMISLMVFTGVFIAFAGGFIMIGCFNTSWFLDFEFLGANMRDLFQVQPINLSVAVWVGFLALFGIATDDGVLVATFLKDSFKKNSPETIKQIRNAVIEGGQRRVRPAMMTTATTILALLPVLTSTGRGADIMLPMAIPTFGGMTLQIITMFTVPILFSLWKEWQLHLKGRIKIDGVLFSLLLITALSFGVLNNVSSQSLSEMIDIGLAENLELKALHQEYLASLEKAPQVTQLPQPELGIGVFPLPVETRLGAQISRFSATQMFPWFGSLERKEKLESAKSKALFEHIGALHLNLIFEIKTAYFQLYEIHQSQEILRQKISLLEIQQKLDLAQVENGQGTTVDLLRLQIKLEELKQSLKILETKRIKPQSALNQLLNRSLSTPVTILDTLVFASLPFQKDSILAQIAQNHPVLRMFELQQNISYKELKINEIEGKPSFGVGVDYILVNQRSDSEPINNGRDILQLRASVKVPIYRKKYEAKATEEKLKITELDFRKADTYTKYCAAIETAYGDYEVARLQMQLYEKQIELSRTAIQILETANSTGGRNFDELLRIEQELLDYKLKRLKAIVQSHMAQSKVERFFIQSF